MDIQQKNFEDDDDRTRRPRRSCRSAHPVPRWRVASKRARRSSRRAKPVIVAGRGASWSGAGEAMLKLAERIGALVATSLMAKTWLAGKTNITSASRACTRRKTAIKLLQEADVVIGVGASLNRYTTEHGYLYPNAKFVHLDTKPHVLMGNARSSDVYIQTDAKLGVEALEAAARAAATSSRRAIARPK